MSADRYRWRSEDVDVFGCLGHGDGEGLAGALSADVVDGGHCECGLDAATDCRGVVVCVVSEHFFVDRRGFGQGDDHIDRPAIRCPIHWHGNDLGAVVGQQLDGGVDCGGYFGIDDVGIEEVVFGDSDAQSVDTLIEICREVGNRARG